MNLVREFVNAAPVKVDLEFGINSDVVLRAVSIEPRMHQGTLIKRNTFMTFTQVNPVTRKAIKEHEYSFFNLNHDSQYVNQNMLTKLTKLVSIVKALGLDVDKAESVFEAHLVASGVADDLEGQVLTLKGASLIDQALSTAFYEVVKGHIGLDTCPLVHFKTTVDRKGYLEIPLYGEFIQSAEDGKKTTLSVSLKEFKARDEAIKTKTAGADKLGKRPGLPGLGGGGLSLKKLNLG
jgi:hypothetical protein